MNMSSPNSYPNSYTSQSYSSQYTPKTPKSINSQTYSSQSSTLTPNSIPQRSLNNNPFETDSSNSNLTDYGIHRSNSTSKLYLKNNSLPITVSAKSDNLNSLHPPDFSHKHQNKKSSVKVYQHTRKVVNDNKSESVEVSEVTQKLYKLNGRDSQHEKSSRYSFTTYTNNENKKKVRHTLSNIEIHSYLSDSSSDNDDNDLSSSQINDSKNKKSKKEKINSIPFNKNTSIETISSQRGLEEQKENNILSEKYNEPLNYTVPANHYQNRSVDYLENNFYNAQCTINNNTNQNKTRKHHSNYGEYTYNETNYSEFDEGPVNIVITNPDNNIISSSNIYKEEESEYPESKYSSTTYNTKDNSVNRSSENSNRSNFSMKNKSQTSPLNSIAISQFNSHNNYNNEYEDSETVNESKMTYNHGNRKKHKTTTTTTTTYEIIEEDDDDDDDENDNEEEEELNEDLNERGIERFVHFNNFPFSFGNSTNVQPRALLTGPSENEVITDKETLNRRIKLRKYSWHTSFYENNGRPTKSMFSIPRYKPEKKPEEDPEDKFEKNSYDSKEDKSCYHILYQFDKEDFIVRLGKALYLYGSPTFRTECTLRSVSKLLGLHGEFASFPTLILLSFSNYNTNDAINSESHLLLTPTGYNLGKLEEVVQITHDLKMEMKNIMHSKESKEALNNNKDDAQKEVKKKWRNKIRIGKNDRKNESVETGKINNSKIGNENDKDSVCIEIKTPDSIDDITQINRRRNSKNSKSDENDITDYTINDMMVKEKNSTENISNNGSFSQISIDFENGNEDDNTSEISIEKHEKAALTAAINKLDYIIAKPPSFGSVFWQLASYVVAGATAAPILFGGTWLDVGVSAFVGLIVGLITYYEPIFFTSHSHLLELLASLGASASLRIIQGIFPKYCVNFTADILSAVLYLLPGLNFTIGFIELASRNMISGTVRLMHSLVTSFMMGAGITIGVHMTKFITVPIVLDTTSEQVCKTLPSPSVYWYIVMFPLLSTSLNMMFFANVSQFPIMLFTTFISYIITIFGTKLNFPNEISIIIAALAVGIISNIYAKIKKRLAIIPIILGVLLLVPGSVGVKGSLAFLIDQNFETGVQFTISMFTVSMWITIGVFLSNLIVFPFKNSEHMGLMTL